MCCKPRLFLLCMIRFWGMKVISENEETERKM